MNTYTYQITDYNGKRQKGTIDALDKNTAIEKLMPIAQSIDRIEEAKSGGIYDLANIEIGGGIDGKALSIMCSQFSIILSSGVAIDDATKMIARQTENKKLKKMLEKAAEDISQGVPIAKAFKTNCPELPTIFTETVSAGELSGTLDESFKTLKKYYENSYKTSQKIKGAMTYPIIVLLIAVVVVIVIMVKVIPSLTGVFNDLGGELPAMTKALISVSDFFRKRWIMIIIGIVALFGIYKIYTSTEAGKIGWGKILLKMPVFGKLNTLGASEQFAETMSTLLKAGLPITNALESTSKVINNYYISQEVHNMVEKIQNGMSLADAIGRIEALPDVLRQMTGIGEQTGELEGTLVTIGDYYANEYDYASSQLLGMLEPIMMVVIALFAGWLVIAIYLPMFTMYELM